MIRRILIILLLASAPLAAQEPAKFFIERIDVRESHRTSRDVVIAESRLREGRTYNESELREASHRVSRAPYLLSADFALEKGSERGKYVLVITVTETKPFFYRADLLPIFPRNSVHVDVTESGLATDNDAVVGFRFFVGRRGAFHFGLQGTADNRSYTSDYSAYAAGYTQYDVFGSRAFVTLNLKKSTNTNGLGTIRPQVVVGIPLSITQTLTVDYDSIVIGRAGDNRRGERLATIRWSYNTTNHPLLPTRGTLVTVAPIGVWSDRNGQAFVFDTPIRREPYLLHDFSLAFETTATRWWQLPQRNSIAAGLETGISRTEERGFNPTVHFSGQRSINTRYATVVVNVAHSFWPEEKVAKRGDSRIELNIRAGPRNDQSDRYYRSEGHVRQVAISWVRHTTWGFLRIGAGTAW